ncbi:MAG: class I SAM-dependent methyltransferase [Dehalococcoidia bacterium]
MKEQNWSALWRELSERFRWPERMGEPVDRWTRRAGSFDSPPETGNRHRSDPILEFVLGSLGPQSTVLDIGAGTGRWSVPMAGIARKVTAIDPSPAMLDVLRRKIESAGTANIEIVQAPWEEVEVEPHDVALCSHGMYASPDLLSFVRKMERSARCRCFLIMRATSPEAVIGELSHRIYGQRHDSPNFIVGYNVLYEAGIMAGVLMESETRPWTNDSLDDALLRAKRHLGLSSHPEHDSMIRRVLTERLIFKEGKYLWEDGKRSALVWWDPGEAA